MTAHGSHPETRLKVSATLLPSLQQLVTSRLRIVWRFEHLLHVR